MITGKVTSIYGKDINTDDIIPASFLQQSNDRKFFKDYAFDRYDPAFRERCKQTTTNIVIGGENFAWGQTMVEKIVSRQVGRKVSTGEKIERLPITNYQTVFQRRHRATGHSGLARKFYRGVCATRQSPADLRSAAGVFSAGSLGAGLFHPDRRGRQTHEGVRQRDRC